MSNNNLLLILPSIKYSTNLKIEGVKAKQIQEIKQKCDKNNIKLKISTYKLKQPIINIYGDEQSKNWVNNFLDKECNENNKNYNFQDLKNININDYKAIIIPSFINIYKELAENDNVLPEIILKFLDSNKIICTIGHSSYLLALVNKIINHSNDKKIYNNIMCSWPFLGHKITGTSIYKFINENLYEEVEKSVEEVIILKGGNYKNPDDEDSNEPFFLEDKNLITGYDDNSLNSCLNLLFTKIK